MSADHPYDSVFDSEHGIAVLRRFIEHYQLIYLPCELRDAAHYAGLKKEEAARSAGLLLRHDGQRHSHAESWVEGPKGEGDKQKRMKRREASISVFAEELVQRKGDLRKRMPFTAVHKVVEEAAAAVSGRRVGCLLPFKPNPLMRYDAALMLAWRLETEPEEVWLHSGAGLGYRKLGGTTKGRKTAPLDEMPLAFRELPAWQVEDILCIYKDVFWRIGRGEEVTARQLAECAHPQRLRCGHKGCTAAC